MQFVGNMNKVAFYSIRFLVFLVIFCLGSNGKGQKIIKQEELNSGDTVLIRSCYAGKNPRRIYIPPPEEYYKAKESGKNNKTIQVKLNGFPKLAEIAFRYAMDIWSYLIESPVDINVNATWESMEGGTLGSTYLDPSLVVRGYYIGAPEPYALYPYPIAEKMFGEEINEQDAFEVEMRINSDQTWYLGTDGETPSDEYDLVSVVLHEMGHGLGFYSTMTEYNGLGYYGYTSGLTYYFDHFIRNGLGQQLIDTSLFDNASVRLFNQYVSNNLFYASPIAQSVNVGASPKLYAPIPADGGFDHGSSISHLDENTYSGTQYALMTPFISTGEAIHHPGEITLAILAEIGWIHTYIDHDTLSDAESLVLPFTVTASITSDTTILSDSLYLFYSTNGFISHDTVQLTGTGNPDEYSAEIPVADTGLTVSYFIQVEDYFNRIYRKPGDAPDTYFQFFVGKDLTLPQIDHDSISFMLLNIDSLQIDATVTDNIGIDSVYIEYFINEDQMDPILLNNLQDDAYRGYIGFESAGLAAGDSIRYRIIAVDISTNSNLAVNPNAGYYQFSVVEIKMTLDIYENDFNTPSNDFLLKGFSFLTPDHFADPALHTIHPYEESGTGEKNIEYYAILTHPIRLDQTEALMKFDEVVLVEPGEDGTVFGDEQFWDYVIVEGSKDTGMTWHPLFQGYDSGINTIWKSTYTNTISNGVSQAVGRSNLLRRREIDLLAEEEFNGGDVILIRFRLFSDPFSYGWGWVIDNLRIQADFSGIENSLFIDNNVWIYPNPVSDIITIEGKLKPGISTLSISITDLLGRNILTREIDISNDELHESINLLGFEPGMYLIHVKSDNVIHTLKIILSG